MACPELLLPRRRGHSPSALLQARGCQCRSLNPSQSSLFGHLGAYMKSLGISPKLLAQEVAAGADEWVPDSLKDLIFLRSWRKLTQSRSGNLTLKARRRDSPNQPGEVERGRVELGDRKKQLCSRETANLGRRDWITGFFPREALPTHRSTCTATYPGSTASSR